MDVLLGMKFIILTKDSRMRLVFLEWFEWRQAPCPLILIVNASVGDFLRAGPLILMVNASIEISFY